MSDDIVTMVWKVIGEEPVTTAEATDLLEELFRYRCPDDLAKTLNRLKREGYVKGRISFERGGWVWWVDDECRSKGVCENGG